MTYDEYKDNTERSELSAQRAVFDEYYAYVCTIVRSRLICCGSRQDVEECVSDAFAEIYIYLDGHEDHDGDITGIISVIAKRKAIDYYNRTKGRAYDTDELSETEADESDIEADLEHKEQRRQLLFMIEQLGKPDSTIIIQKYFFGYKSGEIARSVGMSAAAVRMRCSRALKRLKKMLEKSEQGGNGHENEQSFV